MDYFDQAYCPSVSLSLDIHYMAKSLCTTDHQTLTWAFPKLLMHICSTKIHLLRVAYYNSKGDYIWNGIHYIAKRFGHPSK